MTMIYPDSQSKLADIVALQAELHSAAKGCRYGTPAYKSIMRTWDTLGGYTFGRSDISDADYLRCVRTFNRAASRWPDLLDAIEG